MVRSLVCQHALKAWHPFDYPDNWTLDDWDALLGRKSVTVYSPGGAFWSVAIHSGTADPAKLVTGIVEAVREEYEGLEAQKAEESVAGHELLGYDLAFFCLDLTNTCPCSQSPACPYYLYDLLPSGRPGV